MTTPSDLNIYQLIDTQNGRVTPRIYTDPDIGNDSNLLIVFYVQIMPDD
ncbi:hypothetical protein, partial [Shigella dysenteriae]